MNYIELLKEAIEVDDNDLLVDTDSPYNRLSADGKQLANIIEYVSNTKGDNIPDLSLGKEFNIVESLEGQHTWPKVPANSHLVYAFKFGDDWLKVGQASGLGRIREHYFIYPNRSGGWTKASSLSTSLLMDNAMKPQLDAGGVNTDLYLQLVKDTTLTPAMIDAKYKQAGGKTTLGEWIKNNCKRYIIIITISSMNRSIVANFIEGTLQYNLRPQYEGTTSHR